MLGYSGISAGRGFFFVSPAIETPRTRFPFVFVMPLGFVFRSCIKVSPLAKQCESRQHSGRWFGYIAITSRVAQPGNVKLSIMVFVCIAATRSNLEIIDGENRHLNEIHSFLPPYESKHASLFVNGLRTESEDIEHGILNHGPSVFAVGCDDVPDVLARNPAEINDAKRHANLLSKESKHGYIGVKIISNNNAGIGFGFIPAFIYVFVLRSHDEI